MASFLDKTGVTSLWTKVKELLAEKADQDTLQNDFYDKLGIADGIAMLGADGKLPVGNLPDLKTINGNSIVGSGNITIDLGLYKIVEALPTSNIDNNKIYLVVSSSTGTQNEYTEYIRVNNQWETLGTYKADVDLTPYLKKTELATASTNGVMSASDKSKLDKIAENANNYSLPKASASVLGGIKVGTNLTISDTGVLSATVPTYSEATTSKAGLMSSGDKTKLNGIASNATADTAITAEELAAILV